MPSVSSIRPTMTLALLDSFLAAGNARPAAALIGAGAIELFTAGPLPLLPTMVLADFTAATFAGYSMGTWAPTAPIALPGGVGRGVAANAIYTASGAGPAENILGYYVIDSGGTVIMAEYFDAPIPILNNGDFIDLFVILGMLFAPTVGP